MELKLEPVTAPTIAFFLLIVPHGIETFEGLWFGNSQQLLIVPHGIETAVSPIEGVGYLAFNCTSWN